MLERSIAPAAKGSVSLLILMVLTFLAGVGLISLQKAEAQEKMAHAEARKVQAAYLADSGLEWAKAVLQGDPSWKGGDLNFGGGRIEIAVEEQGLGYRVISRASFQEARQTRAANLTADQQGKLVLSRYEELIK